MEKNKKSKVLAVSLVLAATFGFSVAFAKAQGGVSGAEHRSEISTAVQGLVKAADREDGGVGEQVKVVAQEQNESKDKEADALDKIQNRNKFKTFLIGTDYKNVGQLRSEMVKTRNRIESLKRALNQVKNEANKTAIQEEINALEKEQQKINDFLTANENKFSVFGWFVKLFNKSPAEPTLTLTPTVTPTPTPTQ